MHKPGVILQNGKMRIFVTTNEDFAGNEDSLVINNSAEYFKKVCEMISTGGWTIESD